MPRFFLCLLAVLLLCPPGLAQTRQQQTLSDRALSRRAPGEPLRIDLTTSGATGKGAGIAAKGDATAQIKDFKATAPSANLGGGGPGASGGDAQATVSALSQTPLWRWLAGLGGAALVGLGFWFKMHKNPTTGQTNPHAANLCWIAGATAIGVAILPAWALWVGGAGVVLLIIAFGFVAVTQPALAALAIKKAEGLRATLAAADDLTPAAKVEFENRLLKHAEKGQGIDDLATIKDARVADDIPQPAVTVSAT